MKTWFITGISRGLGLALAKAALADGDTVIGTVRSGAPDLAAGAGTLHVLNLDLADGAAAEAAVERAFGLAGRVDVIALPQGERGRGAMGMAAGTVAAGRPDYRAHYRASSAGLRLGGLGCGVVPRLRGVLRSGGHGEGWAVCSSGTAWSQARGSAEADRRVAAGGPLSARVPARQVAETAGTSDATADRWRGNDLRCGRVRVSGGRGRQRGELSCMGA